MLNQSEARTNLIFILYHHSQAVTISVIYGEDMIGF